jgi:hypothetical protein
MSSPFTCPESRVLDALAGDLPYLTAEEIAQEAGCRVDVAEAALLNLWVNWEIVSVKDSLHGEPGLWYYLRDEVNLRLCLPWIEEKRGLR